MSASADDELLAIELLAGGASLEQLAQRLARARADAIDDEDARERLDALEAAAQQLYRMRAEDRRRLQAMAVLNRTTADLAGLLDVDDLLQTICSRARTLLGTDTAYITLIDEQRGDTFVRATSGVVSASFRRMRLGFGVGLGGLVADSGISVATSDYRADDRFAHASSVDRLVEAEGLRAIVGVPLRRRDEVLGVLLSGSRTTRPFEPGDVALFETLATHAAIAIENAHLFERARDSYRELQRTSAALRQRNREVQEAAALHQQLATLVAEGGSADEVLEEVGRRVGGRLELLADDEPEQAGAARADTGAAGASAGAHVGAGVRDFPVAVALGGDRVARLRWWPPDGGADDFHAELVQRSAVILAGLLLAQRARSDVDHRRRAEFLTALLEPGEPAAELVARGAARIGLSLKAPAILLVADPPPRSDRWAQLRITRAAAAESGAAGELDGHVVVLVPGDDAGAVAERWAKLLAADGAPAAAGVSEPAAGIAGLRSAYREARDALGLRRALGHDAGIARARELGLFALVFGHGPPDGLHDYLRRTLGPLLDHDAARGEPTLLTTLEAYFEEQGQLTRTARRLDIHVNTVYQRLERLDALLGSDWRTPDRQLELAFAIRANRIAADLGHERRRPA
ncbi:GAF domain-containing protein [Conexibacter sp. CPCC 206217]|uniref:helix-turn-helix domain-containing protein n=1 Tax=Conexibacter sp. CPCC 206217 TaxID=3064574 RepID=UPI002716C234|nr:GAF domain-containing protein [Conexibacter sp. CPCC 206217]MDO8209617.1 GAF domain-containing protein [Conexibacter sp. CPCC 206217]